MNAPFETQQFAAPRIKRLNEKAMIVQLKIGRPRFSRRDKDAEALIQREFGDDSMTASKRIFKSKANPVNRVMQEINDLYQWHMKNTWAGADKGDRILAIQTLEHYRTTVREKIEAINRMKDEILPYYDSCVRIDMNERMAYAVSAGKPSTVSIDDYPTAHEFDSRTQINLRTLPLPERTHFLFDVDEQEMQGVEDYIAEVEQAVRLSTVKSLLDPVSALIEKVSKSTDETKIFRQSLINNVTDAIEAFKRMRIDEDPALYSAVMQLDRDIKSYSTEELRDSDLVRQDARAKLQAVADKMAAFM